MRRTARRRTCHDEGVDPYVQQLADAVDSVLASWLERSVVRVATRQLGACSPELRTEAAEMAARVAPEVLSFFHDLLATDVDAQRTNPLSVLRAAVVHPTAVLAAHGVP